MLLIAALFGIIGSAGAADRPNLLIIMTDNQSPSLTGTYGNPEIRTPNIDRLAAEGMQFNNAFATSGVCSPTRATFLTGLLPSQHGVHNALPDRSRGGGKLMPQSWSAIQEFRSLPQTLADAGYATGLIGKFHLGTHEQPQLGFDYWVTFGSGHTMDFYGEEIFDNGQIYIEDGHMTDLWTRKAEAFLGRQSADQPFFLFLSYNGPYMLPPVVLKEPRNPHVDYYRANPPSMPQEPVHPSLMALASRNKMSPIMFRVGFGGWPQIRALNNPDAMINVASEMSTVDDGIGRVLAALDKYGLDDNTLVVVTSDQGSLYGQHGLWGNTSAWWPPSVYDEGMRVPLIFRHADNIAAGSQTETLVNQFDFLPTVLDYLGFDEVEIPQSAGKSYAAVMTGSDSEKESSDIFFEYMTVRVIRTERWLYQKAFLLGADALFDLDADPHQHQNLAEDADYASVVEELDSRLMAFFTRVADPRYDLWQGGTAKLKLFDGGDDKMFAEEFPGWQPPGLGFEQTVFRD
ncbi:MAG: sulfatase-like hydrolase/transferase [Gammaproteobacteria bacterium]|nr:sulfatase-like hydrolase/transferase [Gammaproteobacteria bacterium]